MSKILGACGVVTLEWVARVGGTIEEKKVHYRIQSTIECSSLITFHSYASIMVIT